MIRLAPMTEADFARYMARAIENYAAEVSRANDLTLNEARSQAEASYRRLLPDGRPDAIDQHMYSVVDEAAAVVGMVWFGVRRERKRPYAYIWDIHLDPECRGKGYGEQVMRHVEAAARELGLEHIELNVFGHNGPAIRLYERLGYRTVALSMAKDL